jgi:hypothetical protein
MGYAEIQYYFYGKKRQAIAIAINISEARYQGGKALKEKG